jgi:hypothetical protein
MNPHFARRQTLPIVTPENLAALSAMANSGTAELSQSSAATVRPRSSRTRTTPRTNPALPQIAERPTSHSAHEC